MSQAYDELRGRLREAATLYSVASLLGWDQETMMPPGAGVFRAEEMALISRLAHERATDPRVGELLAACEADEALRTDPVESANLREIRWDYDRATKLPASLVAEMSETSSRALEAWKEARESSDFELFRPWLDRQLALNRRKAECYGAPEGGEPYDALLEDYEPGMTAARIESLFGPLRDDLTPLVAEATASPAPPPYDPRSVAVPLERQKEFNRLVAERLGFDFRSGRLDTSTHPFTEGIAPGDTRITTRYADDHFTDALCSTLHEAGHALYEMGLPKAKRHGEPLAHTLGLGIHESQSRMWENQVGRSRAFWMWALPEAKRIFGSVLEAFSVDDLFHAVNRVEPGLIRVESDETTYNLHIMFRFDIERAMLRGDLAPADLPTAWNERVKLDLGLEVPDDRRGCLQDIHWSMGSIGYFPTYTLGNLYAAQIWETVNEAIPDLDDQIRKGDFRGLLSWLRENIHAHGRRYPAPVLCNRLTGRDLDHRPLIRYLRGKASEIR